MSAQAIKDAYYDLTSAETDFRHRVTREIFGIDFVQGFLPKGCQLMSLTDKLHIHIFFCSVKDLSMVAEDTIRDYAADNNIGFYLFEKKKGRTDRRIILSDQAHNLLQAQPRAPKRAQPRRSDTKVARPR